MLHTHTHTRKGKGVSKGEYALQKQKRCRLKIPIYYNGANQRIYIPLITNWPKQQYDLQKCKCTH